MFKCKQFLATFFLNFAASSCKQAKWQHWIFSNSKINYPQVVFHDQTEAKISGYQLSYQASLVDLLQCSRNTLLFLRLRHLKKSVVLRVLLVDSCIHSHEACGSDSSAKSKTHPHMMSLCTRSHKLSQQTQIFTLRLGLNWTKNRKRTSALLVHLNRNFVRTGSISTKRTFIFTIYCCFSH